MGFSDDATTWAIIHSRRPRRPPPLELLFMILDTHAISGRFLVFSFRLTLDNRICSSSLSVSERSSMRRFTLLRGFDPVAFCYLPTRVSSPLLLSFVARSGLVFSLGPQ